MKKKLLVAFLSLNLLTTLRAQDDLLNYTQDQEDQSQLSDEQLLNQFQESAESAQNVDSSLESDLAKKNGTVPEYELLKTKTPKKKVESKPSRSTDLYIAEAQKFKLSDTFRPLSLNDVIEQGLRKNYDFKIKEQAQEINKVLFNGAKSAFWMPELKIELESIQELATIHSSARTPTNKNTNSPSGRIGLVLGDYSIFNWGKDYALYLNKKDSFSRSESALNEEKRELKQNLIGKYFELLTQKKIEKIWQDNLRQTSFIYRLNKEKITIGKTTRQDYYLARSEYLKSQNQFQESRIDTEEFDEQLAFTIADPIGSKYIINEELRYREINTTLEDILDLAKKNNPKILDSQVDLTNSKREYDVALKEQMPLPKISINLGAYNQYFGQDDNRFRYETYNNGGDVEVVATIKSTWNITGEDGLFNRNKLARARIRREIATKKLEKYSHLSESSIRRTYKTILSLQNQINILQARLTTTQRTFDTVQENYLSGRSRYHDYSLTLEDLTHTKIMLEELKLQHLLHKIELAKHAGIEDFPGETFEQLAVKAGK